MKNNKFTLSHIVAVSQNNVIGLNNKLPWHIPEDLKYFYKTTTNKILIMGRKTFESLGQALPNRLNLVLTQNVDFQHKKALAFVSYEKALEYAQTNENIKKYGTEIFIGGGGEIYKQTINQMDRLYITRIYKNYTGDAFYPEIPKNKFKEVSRIDRTKPVPFSFLVYERVI